MDSGAREQWYIYDQSDLTEKKLSSRSKVIKHLERIPKTRWIYLHLWKPGYPCWVAANECQEILNENFENLSPPPRPGMEAVSNKTMEAVSNKTPLPTNHQKIDIYERRKMNRVNVRYRILVVSPNGKVFRTFTRDVSTEGLCATHSVPLWAKGKTCKIFLLNTQTQENIQFSGFVTNQSSDETQFQFSITDKMPQKTLENWLFENQKTKARKPPKSPRKPSPKRA